MVVVVRVTGLSVHYRWHVNCYGRKGKRCVTCVTNDYTFMQPARPDS